MSSEFADNTKNGGVASAEVSGRGLSQLKVSQTSNLALWPEVKRGARLRHCRKLEVPKLAECPPESGGQHDRDSSRDRAGGGSRAPLFKIAFRNISIGEPPLVCI